MPGKIEVYYDDVSGSGGTGGPRGVFAAFNAAMVLAGSGNAERARGILRISADAACPMDPRTAENVARRLAYLKSEGFTITIDRARIVETARAFKDNPSKATRGAMVDAVADFFWQALDGALKGEPWHAVLWMSICGRVLDVDVDGFRRDVARFVEACPGWTVDEQRTKSGKSSWCEIIDKTLERAFHDGGVSGEMEIVFPATQTDDEVLAKYDITPEDVGSEPMKMIRDDKQKIGSLAFGRWVVSTEWVLRTFIRKNRAADAAAEAARKRDALKNADPRNN